MLKRIKSAILDDGLRARAMRGAGLTMINFGGAQVLRLVSNLILTRILFPEVFGLMALVQVFLIGIEMMSDVGIRTSIIQNKRGEEPLFLNTAWTVQVLRGFALWLIICLIAGPIGNFYEIDMLTTLLPIVGLNAILLGLQSTNMASANRNLLLGRLTILELGTTAFGLIVTVLLAWWLESVWALVFGGLISSSLRLILSHIILPGIQNRPQWEWDAFNNLFHFGKYIFASSVAGFLLLNADRVILGKFLTLKELGIYNIAFFLASVPGQLSRVLVSRVMLPLYRERPPSGSLQNKKQISKARFGLSSVMIALCLFLVLTGDFIIALLYDDRYITAGPMLSLLAAATLPSIILSSYSNLFVAEGVSRDFASFTVVSACCRVVVMWIAVQFFTIPGVILALFLSELLAYPYLLWLLRKYDGWDLRHDGLFGGLTMAIIALALWLNATEIQGMIGF